MDVSSGYRIPAWLLAAYALLTFLLGWFSADARNAWREQAAHAAPVNIATSAPKPVSVGSPPDLGCDEKKLVALRYSAHVWADEPQQRSVTLNGRQYRQGDALACGEEIVDIEPEVLIIHAFGRYLRLHALTDWPGGDMAPLAVDEQPMSGLAAAAESGEHVGQVADNAAGKPAVSAAQGASSAAELATTAESGERAGQVAENAVGEQAVSATQAASAEAGHSNGVANQYAAGSETIGHTNAATTQYNEARAGAAAVSDTLAGFAVSAAGMDKGSAVSHRKAPDAVVHADTPASGAVTAGGMAPATATEALPGDSGQRALSAGKGNTVDGAANDAGKQVDASGLPVPINEDAPSATAEHAASQASHQPAQAVAELYAAGHTGERQP